MTLNLKDKTPLSTLLQTPLYINKPGHSRELKSVAIPNRIPSQRVEQKPQTKLPQQQFIHQTQTRQKPCITPKDPSSAVFNPQITGNRVISDQRTRPKELYNRFYQGRNGPIPQDTLGRFSFKGQQIDHGASIKFGVFNKVDAPNIPEWRFADFTLGKSIGAVDRAGNGVKGTLGATYQDDGKWQ